MSEKKIIKLYTNLGEKPSCYRHFKTVFYSTNYDDSNNPNILLPK